MYGCCSARIDLGSMIKVDNDVKRINVFALFDYLLKKEDLAVLTLTNLDFGLCVILCSLE